jgi:lipopolysaccharide transport system ATP-binding protein
MGDRAIYAEGLSKRYRIGSQQSRYTTLRDWIAAALHTPLRHVSKLLRAWADPAEASQYHWALRDVSFEIKHGEVVGIIGRNGAGKSTLLKIVSQISEPTEGYVQTFGRMGSLLEVGTGFHPELTGRENVYLNGAILGMKRSEIKSKFDEIVTFAEVEKFIDTPVKHYSSGMYLRLAFAVAAHLEPEILIVDEVLAVGDARFHRRCLDKMRDVSREGRTVLFVSHNMSAVSRLCDRTILLDGGSLSLDGPTQEVVSKYLSTGRATGGMREWNNPAKAPGGEIARLHAVRVRLQEEQIADAVDIRQPIALEMEYAILRPGYVILAFFNVFNDTGVHVLELVDLDPEWRRRPRPAGRYVVTAWIPGNLLAEGLLLVSAGVTTVAPSILQFNEHEVVSFHVFDSLDGDSARGDWAGTMTSIVRPLLQWTTQFSSTTTTSGCHSLPRATSYD